MTTRGAGIGPTYPERVWDWLYPDGFWAGAPHRAGDQVRLCGFAQVCSLELGYVPKIVSDAIDPDLPRMLGEYMANLKAARARGDIA
jgi:hypothetical protein